MKNTSSSSSHEPILLHKQHVPIEHIKEAHVENFEKDATIVTRKSERQLTAKSFYYDYIVYHMDDTLRNIFIS